MKELEEIDREIIKILLKDGRKNFVKIAAQCHVSEDIIWLHYKNLKRAGIIVGATSQFNFQKLGYAGLATVAINVESQNVEKVLDRISRIPDFPCYRNYGSTHTIGAISRVKTLKDLENIKIMINRSNKIEEIKTYLWTNCRNIVENIIPVNATFRDDVDQTAIFSSENQEEIDQIDLAIIDALTINGRESFSKIGQKIGVSAGTINRRYEKLKHGNIVKVSLQVDLSKLGFQGVFEIYLSLADQSEIYKVSDELCKIPSISWIALVNGDYDLLAGAMVRDCNNIIEISRQIEKIPNIKKMKTAIQSVPPQWPTPGQAISTF